MDEMKMTRIKECYTVAASSSSSSNNQCLMGSTRSFIKPCWLLSALSELEERMKMLGVLKNNHKQEEEEENTSTSADDTFAVRAEAYYLKRPQLLSLLHDLYLAYLSLADRYSQTLSKHHHHPHPQEYNSSQLSTSSAFFCNDEEEEEENEISSAITTTRVDHSSFDEAESSLSYQHPQGGEEEEDDDVADMVIADLVMKSVDNDVMAHELEVEEETSLSLRRKVELQKSLVEVLESERLILLNENARLGYRVSALVEENRGLAAESVFVKRKAGELARCLLKRREERMFGRKIEDLQRQIYGLEKRNKDYYDQLLLVRKVDDQKKHEEENEEKKMKNGEEVTLEDCFHVDQEYEASNGNGKKNKKKKISKWWGKFKNFDLFMCNNGPTHSNFTCY